MSNEYWVFSNYKDKTQQLLSYPLHFDPRVACCRCVSMIVTAFSSLPLVVVVVVMLLLSCCAGIRVYPAPQITVARVTVTSARCCTQNLSLSKGHHWASSCSDCNQEIREKKKNMRNTTSGIPPQEVGKYESFKHCSPNIRGDKETTRNWLLILNLEHVNASLAPFKLVQKL